MNVHHPKDEGYQNYRPLCKDERFYNFVKRKKVHKKSERRGYLIESNESNGCIVYNPIK